MQSTFPFPSRIVPAFTQRRLEFGRGNPPRKGPVAPKRLGLFDQRILEELVLNYSIWHSSIDPVGRLKGRRTMSYS